MNPLNETTIKKLLTTVDQGLSCGLGRPVPGQMCVEAAVCYALDLPHGDDPGCVSPAVRALKIRLNDSCWSSNDARARGMRRLAVAQLGTDDALDEVAFAQAVAELAHKIACAYPEAAEVAEAAYMAVDYANYAASDAAALHFAVSAYSTSAAVYAARSAAVNAARAAARGAGEAAYPDKILSDFAEDVVQVLIKLDAPGTKFLYLTE